MDSFSGYKLKPSSYSIQQNDIIIRVRAGIPDMPNGQIAIALGKEYVKTYTKQSWGTCYSEWRAIETKPGSEAKVGDTVYCIKDTCGDCQVHDSFLVSDIKMHKFLGPQQGHALLNKKITEKNWKWSSDVFVVLIKAEEASTPSFIPFTIVDSKGNEKTCIRLSKDNWYVSENPNGNRVHHNPLFWTKKEKLKGDIEIANVTISLSPDSITTVSIDSMMNKPTQTKPNLKGKQMNSNLFTDILKLLAQAEQTDLQKAPSTYAFFYNNEGEYEGTARVANEAEAKDLLQKPEHLGYTMRIYSFSDEFTTQIPVVSTIKKTVVAKPTIKPARKPRVPKECKQ